MTVVALVMEALLRGAPSELYSGSSGNDSEEPLELLPQATSDKRTDISKINIIGITLSLTPYKVKNMF